MLKAIGQQLETLSNCPGNNAKIEYLQRIDNNALRVVLNLIYNPYIKYNVNKFPVVESESEDPNYLLANFIDDLELLVERKITGHAALNHCQDIYDKLPLEFKPWFIPLLNKDLKIGVGIGIINSAYENLIPEFKLGLCERWKKIKPEKDLKWPMYLEPKKDGVRALLFVSNDKVEVLARSGIPFENFHTIERLGATIFRNSLSFSFPPSFKEGFVLDGEIKEQNFQATMNNARRKYDADTSNAKFTVWDVLPISEFLEEKCSLILSQRKHLLNRLLCDINDDTIHQINHIVIHSIDELKEAFQYWYEQQGEEGVIVKDPDSLYIYSSGNKRGKAWIKYKIQDHNGGFAEYSARVTSVNKGADNTKYFRVLGSFSYEATMEFQGQNVVVTGNVGSGFTDIQRLDFWNRRDELVGLWIDIEAQEITMNKEGQPSLRFPIFKRFRPDLG